MKKQAINKEKTSKSKNNLKDKLKGMSIGDWINSIIALFTFISLILVGWSIIEMRRDRDAAYRPSLLMNPVEYSVTWNDQGEEPWLSSSDTEEESMEILEDGTIQGSITIPMTLFPDDGLEVMSVVNIGVGTAKDIVFTWDEENIELLTNQLLKINPEKQDFCLVDQNITFLINDHIIVTDIPTPYQLMYMLPDAEQEYKLPIPTSYTILIHEILKESDGNISDEFIHFSLDIEYKDVQGKKFTNTCLFYVKRVFSEDDLDNENSVTYQLVPYLLV
ncbi:hypothetical protein [Mediterraneibacter glycyrrhizinilyticus]|uniref:hypothetical protein n=1 Tax=Mediterraneibacter glycyrrhizinilyticus TaxID=342942 RepID=UPI0025AA36E4|nr:hypothetical protein [Mediterraneibacter glycyrrhizinilyticus]MDN0044885.1 hypothetical protein [Mediterraneibacter glycyrrhizinilyticus]